MKCLFLAQLVLVLQLVYAVVGPVQLYYQTTPGEVYGPFPDQQVFSWWKQGYFADDLPVSTDGSSFVAIRQFFGSNNPQISQPSVIPEPKVQADTEMNGYSMVEYQPRKSSFFSFKDITKKAKSMVKSKLSKINMYRFGRSRDEDLTPQSVGFYESGQSAEIRGTQLDGEEEEYNSDYSGYDDESSEVNEKGISPGVSVSIDEPRAKQQPEVGGDFVDSLSDSQNEEEKAFLRSNAPKSEQRRDDYDDYSVKSIGVKDYDVWNTELDGKSSFYDVGSSESGLARKIKRAAMSFTALITYPLLFLVSLIVPSSLRLYGVLLIQSGSIAGGVIALIAVLELINKILKGTGFSIFLLWLASLEAHLASKFKESSVLMSCPSSSSECGSIEQFSGSPTPFSAITEETRTNFSGKAGNVPRSVMELIKGIDLQNTIKDSVAYIRSATFHRNTKMAILFVFALSVLNSIWLPWSKELLRKRLGRSSQESLVGNEIKIDHVAAFRYVSQFTKILISFIIMGLSSYTSTAIGNILQISINSQMLLNFPNLLIICIGIVEMVLVKPVLSWSGDTNYAKKDSVLEEFEFSKRRFYYLSELTTSLKTKRDLIRWNLLRYAESLLSIEKETIAGLAEEMKNRKNNFIIGSWLRITRFLIWNFIVCVSVICSSYKLYEVAQLQDLNFEVNPIDVIIQSVKSTVRSLSDKSYFIQSLENGFEKIGSSLKFTHSDSLEPMGALIILASLSIAIPLQQWYKLARNLWGVIEVKECLSSTRSDLFIPLTNSQDIEDDEEFGWSIAGPNLYDGLKLKNLKVVDAFGDIVLKDVSLDIPSGKVTAIVACSAESYDEQADGPDHHQEENGDRERVVDAFMEACWPLSYSSQTATSFEGDVTVHGRSIQDWNKQYLSGLMTYLKKNELPMNIQAGAYAGCPPNASPTVRENFLIAAELSGAARIISELPYGPATLINDGASKLASSDHSTHLTNDQWRRLALCRALTNIGRKIVLLSYPTDLLNEQEEEKLFNFLRSSVQKNQVILVGCRRLLTSTFADCIVALSDHDGSVLQQGEASDLQTKAGPFKQELQKYVIAEENEWGEAGLAQTELDEIIETRGPQDFDPFPKNLQYEQTVDRMYSAGLDAYPNHNTD